MKSKDKYMKALEIHTFECYDSATIQAFLKKAETYRQYIEGWAYIPLQNLPIYEKAYNYIRKNKLGSN